MKQHKRQFANIVPMGLLACVGAVALMAGCGGGSNGTLGGGNGGGGNGGGGNGGGGNGGAVDVFALTNESNNRVVAFSRASNGSLTLAGMFETKGAGSGSPLDSQGALILSPDRRFLYASNPGSDEISVFSVSANNLSFVQKISSSGDLPLSLTMHGSLLYALNSGTGSNIAGFRVGGDGRLAPLANSKRMLSTGIGLPAQIQFNPAGTQLVVTQKVTSVIDTYAIGADGLPSGSPPPALAGKQNPSVGKRPFGFAFRPSDSRLVVSESFDVLPGKGAASSYNLAADGTLSVISGSVPNGGTDSCWIAISKDGRYVYESNFISHSISSYAMNTNGAISLIKGVAADTGANSQAEDLGISADGKTLYVLLTGVGRVGAYTINGNGSLTALSGSAGIPAMAGATGLAVR